MDEDIDVEGLVPQVLAEEGGEGGLPRFNQSASQVEGEGEGQVEKKEESKVNIDDIFDADDFLSLRMKRIKIAEDHPSARTLETLT